MVTSPLPFLHAAIKSGSFGHVPLAEWTPERIKERDNVGRTTLHLAAYHDCLGFVPKQVLTDENLLTVDYYGVPLLHCAYKQLDKLPAGWLKEEHLLAADADGRTTLHVIVEHECLIDVPENLLSAKVLLCPDKSGKTPFHLAVMTEQASLLEGVDFGDSTLPRKYLTPEWCERNQTIVAKKRALVEVVSDPDPIDLF